MKFRSFLAIFSLVLASTAALAAEAPLKAQKPIVVPGGAGGFDWMLVDPDRNVLFATHPDKKTLTTLNLKTHKVKEIAVGDVSGVAIDAADSKIFVGGAGQHIIVLDRQTLTKIDDIPVTGPVDNIVFDPKNDTIYADHDDGTEVWVIDGKTNKITGTVPVAGAPEYIAYDAGTDRLYQNIKPANQTSVIDPATNTVVATWPTAPAKSPHGLAIDAATEPVSAGKNGKLAVLDLKTGSVITSVDIAPGTDQIAFDPGNKRVYCATGGGFISVVQETDSGAALVANVPVAKEAHTIAVDPATHDVWICYPGATESYLQKFVAAK